MDENKVLENTCEFEERVKSLIHRGGIDKFMLYLNNETDFFYSPCSTRFHLCEEGGLIAHSMHVHDNLCRIVKAFDGKYTDETIAICALFHDVCKANCYKPVKKSRKTGRLQPNGKPEWEDYMGYDFDEEFPYGHGEKSVYILRTFMDLSAEEAMAIRWHMGFSDSSFKGGSPAVSNAMGKYPLVALLHSADLIATAYGG